jgi:hypothetical protein
MFASLVRTVVPVIVGVLLGWAAKVGLNLPEGAVTEIVTVTLTAVYYALARLLEAEWPAVGRWLLALGLPVGRPTYTAPPVAPPTSYRSSL